MLKNKLVMTFDFNWTSSECDLDIGEHFETQDDIIHDHFFTPGTLMFYRPKQDKSKQKPTSENAIVQPIIEQLVLDEGLEDGTQKDLDKQIEDLKIAESPELKEIREKLKKKKGKEKSDLIEQIKEMRQKDSSEVSALREEIKGTRKNLQSIRKSRRHSQRLLLTYEKFLAWNRDSSEYSDAKRPNHQMTDNEKKVVDYYAKMMPHDGKKGHNKTKPDGHRRFKIITREAFNKIQSDLNQIKLTNSKIQPHVFSFLEKLGNLLDLLKEKPNDDADPAKKKSYHENKKNAVYLVKVHRRRLFLYMQYYKETYWGQESSANSDGTKQEPNYMTDCYKIAMKCCQQKFVPSKNSNNNAPNSDVRKKVEDQANIGLDYLKNPKTQPEKAAKTALEMIKFTVNSGDNKQTQNKKKPKTSQKSAETTESTNSETNETMEQPNDAPTRTATGDEAKQTGGGPVGKMEHVGSNYVPSYLRPFT